MEGIETLEDKSVTVKRSAEPTDNEPVGPDQKKSKIDADLLLSKNDKNADSNSNSSTDVQNKKTDNDQKPNNNLTSVDKVVKSNDTVSVSISGVEKEDEKSSDSVKQTDADNLSSMEFGERMKEVDVGITEFMGTHTESFEAIIKQRYSDFIVNEIDQDGNIVHLENLDYEEEVDKGEDEEEEKKLLSETAGVLSEADIAAIKKIVNERNKEGTHDILAPEGKELRTKIHLAVKQNFSPLETTTTEDSEGNKIIRVTWRTGKRRDRNRIEWPESKKSCRYVKFVLYKENKDTMDAIGLIAKNLRVKESMFQYAGTKDKRAKTTQEITAHRIHPKQLVNLNKVLWNMGLGHFRYVQQPLQLGHLSGNHFVIVLRNVLKGQDVVDTALNSLKAKGFINYYGMQRFGTTSIPTHAVGSTLLQGDWAKAIDLILSPRNDMPAKDKFQKIWAETKDPQATFDATPVYCGLERNVLGGLMKNMKPLNALDRISRNTRLLYIHSYQSLVWNKMVSRRLAELGHGVVVGDLVMKRQEGTSGSPTVVTEETVRDYSLSDVVLPLPGYDVIYPTNAVGDWYRETLTSDGLDIDNMRRPQKDYSLSGAYRHLMVLPKDVTWTHHRYNDYTQALTLSDLDLIQGHTLPDCGDTGKLSAVVVRMSLPSSCYATMALREVMRVDTSSFHQAAISTTPTPTPSSS